jgi:hypothetical protein
MEKQVQVFNHLKRFYPIPNIPKYTSSPENAYLDDIIHRFIQQTDGVTIHDMIKENLHLLVPDINTQYSNEMSTESLESWIKLSKLYMKFVYDEFQRKCYEEEKKLLYIVKSTQRYAEFDMTKMGSLPEDVIRIIYSYLHPRVRCDLLLYKYPVSTIIENLYKLSAPTLRGLTVFIYETYYIKIFDFPDSSIRQLVTVNYRRIYKNKDQAITQIADLLRQIVAARPKSMALIRFLNDMSFRLLRTVRSLR